MGSESVRCESESRVELLGLPSAFGSARLLALPDHEVTADDVVLFKSGGLPAGCEIDYSAAPSVPRVVAGVICRTDVEVDTVLHIRVRGVLGYAADAELLLRAGCTAPARSPLPEFYLPPWEWVRVEARASAALRYFVLALEVRDCGPGEVNAYLCARQERE